MSDFIPRDTPFTGRRMLIVIFTFFGVIIAVNGIMLTLAIKTFGGLVVDNSYVASQHFDQDIAAAKAQPIHGWTLDLVSEAGTVALTASDRDKLPVRNLDLVLKIDRPTNERNTAIVPLVENEPGFYVGDVTLEPGQWIAIIHTGDGQTRSMKFNHAEPAS